MNITSVGIFYIVFGITLLMSILSAGALFLGLDVRDGDPFFPRFLRAFGFLVVLIFCITLCVACLIIVTYGLHLLGLA